MIKYHGDRIWVKIQLAVASILWGLLVAYVSMWVTRHLAGPFQTLLRVVIFLIGFYSLEIGARQVLPEDESS